MADSFVSVKVQRVPTELEARLGLHERAHTHLKAAQSLLSNVSERGLDSEGKLFEFALAAWEANLSGAREYAFELLSMAADAGSESARFGASTNLGHLLPAQSRLDEAIAWIREGLGDNGFSRSTELALRDTLKSPQLSMDLDDASVQAEVISLLFDKWSARDSYDGFLTVPADPQSPGKALVQLPEPLS